MNLVEINNVAIGIKDYDGRRVITLKDIDKVHERPNGTSRKAFNRNKQRFIEGEDYFVHDMDDSRKLFGITAPNGLTTITESGYLMIAKVFDDDLSWEVQRKLVDSYFRSKQPDQNYQPFLDMLTTLSNSLSTIQQNISDLKENQSSIQHQLTKKRYSPWGIKMYPKYKLLTEYFDISFKELYRNLYLELENTYPDIDLNQEVEDYCYANNLDSAYTLDVIEHTKSLRKLFTSLVDSIIERCNLTEELELTNVTKRKTIFDDIPIQRKTEHSNGE